MAKYRVAIAYDFDGTLAQGNIQENSFLPELGIKKEVFWNEVKELSRRSEMDEILAYMFLLIKKARDKEIKYDRKTIEAHGKEVQYFKGVETWFDRINVYAKQRDIALEHYVISSGNREMIMGTSIAKYFKAVYASAFKYDANNVPEWPALAVNYTNKTQYLFRINKGIENAWDDSEINAYTPDEERPILFPNMLYIGDGLTDVPAMKMINYQGGYSIGLYAPDDAEGRQKVEEMLGHDRVKYMAKADYSENEDLDVVVKNIINRIAKREQVRHFTKYRLTKKK